MVRKYEVLKDSVLERKAKVGTVVYDYHGYDYGCANDDTRMTGVEHQTMTLDPEGGGPFFTMPCRDLKLIE